MYSDALNAILEAEGVPAPIASVISGGVQNTANGISGMLGLPNVSSITNNVGILLLGVLLLLIGGFMLVFSWGEHLAGVAENALSKIPVSVPL